MDAARSHFLDYDELVRIIALRNEVAHNPSADLDWEAFEAALHHCEAELQRLGILLELPTYEYFGEQSAMRNSLSVNVISERTVEFGVRANGRIAMSISRVERLYRSDRGTSTPYGPNGDDVDSTC